MHAFKVVSLLLLPLAFVLFYAQLARQYENEHQLARWDRDAPAPSPVLPTVPPASLRATALDVRFAALYSEQIFYHRYTTLVWRNGLGALREDERIEAGRTIDPWARFNLLPEAVLGLLLRLRHGAPPTTEDVQAAALAELEESLHSPQGARASPDDDEHVVYVPRRAEQRGAAVQRRRLAVAEQAAAAKGLTRKSEKTLAAEAYFLASPDAARLAMDFTALAVLLWTALGLVVVVATAILLGGGPVSGLAAIMSILGQLKVATRADTHVTLRENYALPCFYLLVFLLLLFIRRQRLAEDAAAGIAAPESEDEDAAAPKRKSAAPKAAMRKKKSPAQAEAEAAIAARLMGPAAAALGRSSGIDLDEEDAKEGPRMPGTALEAGMFACAFAFLLCWQFAQFPLLALLMATYAAYAVSAISFVTASRVFIVLAAAGIAAVVALGTNTLLLASPFVTSALALATMGPIGSVMRPAVVGLDLTRQWRAWNQDGSLVRRSFLFLTLVTVGRLAFLSTMPDELTVAASDDGNHMVDLLWAKWDPSFATFDTLLYHCSTTYRAASAAIWGESVSTMLLPRAVAVAVGAVAVGLAAPVERRRVLAGLILTAALAVPFGIMAALFMRLHLLSIYTTVLLSSCIFSTRVLARLVPQFFASGRAATIVVVALLAIGVPAAIDMRSHFIDRQADPVAIDHTVQLMEWIRQSTEPDAVFAASMDVSPQILTQTGRKIVHHPHYENGELRRRTREVFSMYGREPEKVVFDRMRALGVDYLIVDFHCDSTCIDGGGFDVVFHANEGKLPERRKFCEAILDGPQSLQHFVWKYYNDGYFVLEAPATR